jgi:cyclic di-GMP phosphodiesterase
VHRAAKHGREAAARQAEILELRWRVAELEAGYTRRSKRCSRGESMKPTPMGEASLDHRLSVLVVDDVPSNVALLTAMLVGRGYVVDAVTTGQEALRRAEASPPDLILLDISMPGMDGFETCRRLKANPLVATIPVIFLSALSDPLDKTQAFKAGGVDYVTKPFETREVLARVETHLRLARLQRELEENNRTLQARVEAQVREISEAHLATITALSKLAESRDDETGNHIVRVEHYCQALARTLAEGSDFAPARDPAFASNLFHASPLHDIGKVALPDAILLKPGPLAPEERRTMEGHTLLGASTLAAVQARYPNNAFLNMGIAIARSHHERWDGTGYPDGLVEEAIPAAARIVFLADQYDALRSVRPYKPSFDHPTSCKILLEGDDRTRPEHFDPNVLRAFRALRDEFAAIHARLHAMAD